MIELIDTFPDVQVQAAEYGRLLGYPAGVEWSERARELAGWARAWYTRNGRPWVYAREAESVELAGPGIAIEGQRFSTDRLRQTLLQAEAHSVILVAVGAGAELEQQAQALWREEKPDEYFFLEVYGSAVVEHLTTTTGARLCGWAESHEMAILPHYSPGYPEWDIAEQPRLMGLLKPALPANVEVLESGMLRPKKSLLAVFGVTRHTERVRRITELNPCENCSLPACQYRRVPYRRAAAPADAEPSYTVNRKALNRWSKERLLLNRHDDGTIDARFLYEGTTCTNMGRPLSFVYEVQLGPKEEGYPIRGMQCAPAAGYTGHMSMCAYLKDAGRLMLEIATDQPLLGKPLAAALSWKRSVAPAGCYCDPASRLHKWGLVLETIHYALAIASGREKAQPVGLPPVLSGI